jgi:hypothetical protein
MNMFVVMVAYWCQRHLLCTHEQLPIGLAEEQQQCMSVWRQFGSGVCSVQVRLAPVQPEFLSAAFIALSSWCNVPRVWCMLCAEIETLRNIPLLLCVCLLLCTPLCRWRCSG